RLTYSGVYCTCCASLLDHRCTLFPPTPTRPRLFPSPVSAALPADSLYRVRRFGPHLNLRGTRLIRLPTVAPGWVILTTRPLVNQRYPKRCAMTVQPLSVMRGAFLALRRPASRPRSSPPRCA